MSARGQATVIVVLALGLASVLAAAAVGAARAALERAHAQRLADEAALGAAAVLDHGAPAAAAAARRVVRGVRVVVGPAGVRVRIVSPTTVLARAGRGVPALVLRVRAEATAAPLTTGLDAVPAFVPGRYRAAVTEAASRERLRPALLAAVLEVESGFRPRATSSAGAVGLAQFLPATWAGTWNPWRAHDPREPGPAIAAAARYLGRLLAALDGDEARALAAYNAGVAAARRPASTWPAETRAYVPKVLALAASGGRRGAHLVR